MGTMNRSVTNDGPSEREQALLLLALAPPCARRCSSQTTGGLWEVSARQRRPIATIASRTRSCSPSTSICGRNCTRDVIRNQRAAAEIHYTCSGGAFGQSNVELLTPRSLRIETQGISDNAPFHYVLQARRIGNC